MMQRLFLNFLLFFVFAIVQIGVITHEISHLSEHSYEAHNSNSDKNSTIDQCSQCIASAQAVSGLPSVPFAVFLNQGELQLSTPQASYLASALIAPYSARAPPTVLNS